MIKLYYYNGYNKPELVEDYKSILIKNTYKGDLTEDFREDCKYFLNSWELESLIENQPLEENYSIWINPTLKQLQDFNEYVGLDKNDYLEEYKED